MTGPWAADVFCGTGGMTDGMLAAGFQVLGVDVVQRPEYRGHLLLKDVRELEPFQFAGVDWMHGSPPCTRFSTARAGRKADPPTLGDLDLLLAFLDLKDAVKPRFWSVENVRGAVRHFEPVIGKPRLRHGAFNFWGNFPPFLVEQAGLTKGFMTGRDKNGHRKQKAHRHKDPWLRARLPEQITRPMAAAVRGALA